MIINLLQEETKKFGKVEKIKKVNRIVVVMAASVFVGLLIAFSSQYMYYTVRLTAESLIQKKLDAKYNSRAEDVVKYIRLKKTLIEINAIIGGRLRYRALLRNIYDTITPGVMLASAEFIDEDRVSLSMKAVGVREYADYVNNIKIKSNSKDFMFKNVEQKSLTRKDDGSYVFELSLVTKPE